MIALGLEHELNVTRLLWSWFNTFPSSNWLVLWVFAMLLLSWVHRYSHSSNWFSSNPGWRHSIDNGESQGPWGSGESPPPGKGYCWHAERGITWLDISSVVFFL